MILIFPHFSHSWVPTKVNKTFTMKKCGGGKNAANVDKSGSGKKATSAYSMMCLFLLV